ncbi:MAG: hypothetical protein EAX95_10100 [Candidatus Thorarchaeota archaeon]|nr:hypothetical protein [Candidatus Thorarchaeota archaeon]
MMYTLNLLLASALYILLWVAYGAFKHGKRVLGLERIGREIAEDLPRAAVLYEAFLLYFVVSLALWIGRTDTAAIPLVSALGLVAGIVVLIDLYNDYRGIESFPSGPNFYISTIKFHYRHGPETKLLEAITGLYEESASDNDAKIALTLLLERDDELGVLTRKHSTGDFETERR